MLFAVSITVEVWTARRDPTYSLSGSAAAVRRLYS